MGAGNTATADAAAAMALGISFQLQLDDTRILTMQTHIDRDDDPKNIAKLLDGMAYQQDRLQARYRKQKLERDLAMQSKQLVQLREDFASIDKRMQDEWKANNRQGPFKLDAKQKADRGNAMTTQQRYEKGIEDTKAEIAACDELLTRLEKPAGT